MVKLNRCLWYRCAVHGFTVLAGACLGHSWPRSLLVKAQILMVYIYSSPEVRAMLQPSTLLPPGSHKEGVLLVLSGLEYTVTNLINMEQVSSSLYNLPFPCLLERAAAHFINQAAAR